jgi:prepilin-type N-terminal cleavage/methylation domain-containing protein
MASSSDSGFSLVELAIVLVVLGLVLSFGVPGFSRYTDDLALKGAADGIAAQLRLMRDRAMSTRSSQTMKFQAGYSGTDYRVENGGVIQSSWNLPRRISFSWVTGTINTVTMSPDGMSNASGLIILQNTRGQLDTVSVLASGLVLSK